MSKFHRPRTGHIASLTLTSSALCPDMRDVASASIKLRWFESDKGTLTATLGTASADALPVTYTWTAETAALAANPGTYTMIAEATRTGAVVVASEPYEFEIVDDFESTT